MIILKHNGSVYIAKSHFSLRDDIMAARISPIVNEENVAMWHPGGQADRLIATRFPGMFSDFIMYEDFFPTPFDEKHLVFDAYDALMTIVEENELGDGDGLPDDIAFAEGERAFLLYGNGARVEIEGFHSILPAWDGILALYDISEITDPYDFLRKAYRLSENLSGQVMFPVAVMRTGDTDIKVIER